MTRKRLGLTAITALMCAHAHADKYGLSESDGLPPGNDGMWFLLQGIALGAGAGWLYARVRNSGSKKKIATDGCMILGGMVGPFVMFLLVILFR